MYKLPRTFLTSDVIQSLERTIQRNMGPSRKLPPRFTKSTSARPPQLGPGGQKGWWVTTDGGRKFFISKQRAKAQKAFKSKVSKEVGLLPNWQRTHVKRVHVQNASLSDKFKLGNNEAIVLGEYQPSSGIISLTNSWVANKLGDAYNSGAIIRHEATHAVTARNGIFNPSDSRRPQKERDLINTFIGAVRHERSSPTSYASIYDIATPAGFHEHFAEWNELSSYDRRMYGITSRKYPHSSRAYKDLVHYYTRQTKSLSKADNSTGKIIHITYFDDAHKPVKSEKDATFAHVIYSNGKQVYAWLPSSKVLSEFDSAHGGNK